MVVCFYLCCCNWIKRLARFNVQTEKQDKRFFIGIHCPSTAAVIASMVWIGTDFAIPGKRISELVAAITIIFAVLMVSDIKYHSFKEINLKDKVPIIAVLIVVFFYSLIAWDPPK